jgi:hypothetical protein
MQLSDRQFFVSTKSQIYNINILNPNNKGLGL